MSFLACVTTVILLASVHGAKVAQDECSMGAMPELAASLLQNLQQKQPAKTKADKLFDELDVNSDGQLSKEEFQRYQKFEAVTDVPAAGTTPIPGAATTVASDAATTMASAGATDAVTTPAGTFAPTVAATMAPKAATTMGSDVATVEPKAATTMGSDAATTLAPDTATTMAANAVTTMAANAVTTMAADAATTMGSDAATMAADAATTMGSDAATMAADAATTMGSDAATMGATTAAMSPDSAATATAGMTTAAATAATTKAPTTAPVEAVTPAVIKAKPAAKVEYVATAACCGVEEVQTGGQGMKLTSVSGALPEGLRYAEVFPGVDLVVMAADAYVGSRALNGIENGLGAISLKGSSSTSFKFRFYKTGTEDAVSVDELYLSFSDLDKSADLTEQVEMVTGAEYVFHDQGCNVRWTRRNATHPAIFTGTSLSNSGMPLKDVKSTISWRFKYVTEVELKLIASEGNSEEARVFYFTGTTKLTREGCVKGTEMDDISINKIGYSNLAGKGPSVLSPHGLLFKGVKNVTDEKSMLGYKSIDMLITNTEGRYMPQVSERNGLGNGGFGSINFEGGKTANFSFSFKSSNEAMPLENLVLTFFDVDRTPAGGSKDTFIVKGMTRGYLSDNSKFEVEEMGGGYYGFTGSFNEDASMKLPSDPFHLTPEQQARSFAVEFQTASVIELTVDLTHLPAGAGRTIYFAGHSRLTAGRELGHMCMKNM